MVQKGFNFSSTLADVVKNKKEHSLFQLKEDKPPEVVIRDAVKTIFEDIFDEVRAFRHPSQSVPPDDQVC